jgi:hypothetical protein
MGKAKKFKNRGDNRADPIPTSGRSREPSVNPPSIAWQDPVEQEVSLPIPSLALTVGSSHNSNMSRAGPSTTSMASPPTTIQQPVNTTYQSVSAHRTNSAPIPAMRTPYTPPQNTGKGSWTGLRKIKTTLDRTVGTFGPLKSVADGVDELIQMFEVSYPSSSDVDLSHGQNDRMLL